MKKGEKKKTVKEIPHFKSYEEEAHFWDTHSFLDYVDEDNRVGLVLEEPTPKKNTIVQFKVYPEDKVLLEKRARKEETTVSALLRSWMHKELAASAR